MLTSRHLISSSLGMLYVYALCPSACVQLSGLGAARSLPNPSLACLESEISFDWSSLPRPQFLSPLTSLALHLRAPPRAPSRQHRSAQTLQMCLSKVACVTPPDFPFYSIFR